MSSAGGEILLKTVLHLLSSNKLSGAENVAIDIISNLGNLYKAYYSCPGGPIREILNQKQISCVFVDKMTPLAIKEVIKQLKPDIIHAHDYRASVVAAMIKGDVKLISHLHSNYGWAQTINSKTLLYYGFLGRIDNIIAVSNAVLQDHACYKRMMLKTSVIHNCIDLEKIYDIQYPKENREIDLLFVGRLTEQKDPLRFITCVSKLVAKGNSIKAGMLGEGELREACIKHIRQLELEDIVTMYGFQANPYTLMADSRILILPSKSEGFGLVAMEAMSLGVPIVCTGVGGLKEIVSNGHDGFICNNIDEIVNAVGKLLTDNECWHQMSKNALETASKRNDMKSYIAKIEALYR